jgi:hypothetical protein
VNINMTLKRGYRSALSACPAPASVAAFAAAPPAEARLRGVGVDVRPHLDASAAAAQGTGLPIAGRLVADVPSMTFVQLVQPHPGDRARRPPA